MAPTPEELELTTHFAHLNAAQLQLAQRAADWADSGAWYGDGIRSCEHWLTINTGCDLHTAAEYIRVGRALRDLPLLRDAAPPARSASTKCATSPASPRLRTSSSGSTSPVPPPAPS